MMGCVMLLRGFKFSLMGSVLLLGLVQGGHARAAGIPVYCFNCGESSHNAAHSILDGIRSQTEAIVNAWGYAIKSQAKVDLSKDASLAKTNRAIENAGTYNPKLSKPRGACASYEGAAGRNAAAGAVSSTEVQKEIGKIAADHNSSASKLSDTEPKREYFVGKVLDRMHGDDVDSSSELMVGVPFEGKELAKTLEKIAFVTNPFPVDMPSEKALKAIKESGSTGDKEAMAKVLVNSDRLKRSQAIIMSEKTKDAKLFDGLFLKMIIKSMISGLSEEGKKQYEGKISANQMDEIMTTYRVKSSDWVEKTMKLNDTGLLREHAVTQAEILNQLWLVNKKLTQLIVMQAYADVQNTAQKGVTSK